MRRKVLIVTSTYAPAMLADMQRARMLARDLPALGWDVEILTPDDSFQLQGTIDADSAPFFEPATPVHRVAPRFARLFDRIGVRTIGWRAFLPMLLTGSRLLASRKFDLVYVSTTQFNLFLLGLWWRRTRGVPYVLDIHDPCWNPAHANSPSLKRRIHNRLHRWIESAAVRGAAGIVSVSPGYLRTLLQRHGGPGMTWTREECHAVIPFAGSPADLALAAPAAFDDGGVHRIAYVGAGAPVMARSFECLCAALAQLRRTGADDLHDVRIEIDGTASNWRPGDPALLAEIAARWGLGDVVSERPRRISYCRSLELLKGASGALVLGVDDADYMPSKLFTYALSGLPLLGVLHSASAGAACFEQFADFGHLLAFDGGDSRANVEAVRSFLQDVRAGRRFARADVAQRYGTQAMAAAHARLFESCVAAS